MNEELENSSEKKIEVIEDEFFFDEHGVKRNKKTGQIAKGYTANPDGKPEGAGISITTEIKRKLKEIPPDKKHDYLHYLIEQILKKAIIEGDQQMIKQIWNYIDGMPKQTIELDPIGQEDRNTLKDIVEKMNNEQKGNSQTNS